MDFRLPESEKAVSETEAAETKTDQTNGVTKGLSGCLEGAVKSS